MIRYRTTTTVTQERGAENGIKASMTNETATQMKQRNHNSRRIMLQALAFFILGLGVVCYLAIPQLTIAPLLPSYLLLLILYCKFIPSEKRHLVGYIRLLTWLVTVQVW